MLTAAEVGAAIKRTQRQLVKVHTSLVEGEMTIRSAGLAPRVEWMRIQRLREKNKAERERLTRELKRLRRHAALFAEEKARSS